MATSESDDFESADEELVSRSSARNIRPQRRLPTAIDSESDDDFESREYCGNSRFADDFEKSCTSARNAKKITDRDNTLSASPVKETVKDSDAMSDPESNPRLPGNDKVRTRPTRKSPESRQTTTKKLGTRIAKTQDSKDEDESDKVCLKMSDKDSDKKLPENLEEKGHSETDKALSNEEYSEMEMPEELRSDKKFKEVFKPEGWEGLGDDIELPDELTEDKLRPVFNRLALIGDDTASSSSWGHWGNWGVSSLINTATAGVSTLTSHVTHGITMLEETMGMPESMESLKAVEDDQQGKSSTEVSESNVEIEEEKQLFPTSFGFGNLLSGVTSITKLVETTGSKVVTGGLDTLEAIGKKTMEVLQEGDPGLKKKRAFFTNEADKPILSQVLREAKEKAEAEEKSHEERQLARKVHFESLFDDYQGLVHLEALEMLSKQSTIKIQQRLLSSHPDEINSLQETLEEVKELCDLGDEDEDEKEYEEDLETMLRRACNDLGVAITYEKLYDIPFETDSYLRRPVTHTDQDIYQHAISTLAQFTAYSVERFHKTAELLLVKERRSTVNEADSLVQLTHILTYQIGVLANAFCDSLNAFTKLPDKSESVKANITAVFLEAANASSYIQDAFRLLIPILQVGAI